MPVAVKTLDDNVYPQIGGQLRTGQWLASQPSWFSGPASYHAETEDNARHHGEQAGPAIAFGAHLLESSGPRLAAGSDIDVGPRRFCNIPTPSTGFAISANIARSACPCVTSALEFHHFLRFTIDGPTSSGQSIAAQHLGQSPLSIASSLGCIDTTFSSIQRLRHPAVTGPLRLSMHSRAAALGVRSVTWLPLASNLAALNSDLAVRANTPPRREPTGNPNLRLPVTHTELFY